jgi:hypothetical protein
MLQTQHTLPLLKRPRTILAIGDPDQHGRHLGQRQQGHFHRYQVFRAYHPHERQI